MFRRIWYKGSLVIRAGIDAPFTSPDRCSRSQLTVFAFTFTCAMSVSAGATHSVRFQKHLRNVDFLKIFSIVFDDFMSVCNVSWSHLHPMNASSPSPASSLSTSSLAFEITDWNAYWSWSGLVQPLQLQWLHRCSSHVLHRRQHLTLFPIQPVPPFTLLPPCALVKGGYWDILLSAEHSNLVSALWWVMTLH